MTAAGPYDYRVFGLAVRSDIALDELAPFRGDEPDIVIRLADLPPGLPTQAGHHQLGERSALLVIDEVGRFLADGGRSLLIEPAPAVPPRNLRLFLLGSAMGMLLHQRGLLPLHANAVVIDGRAYAFTGPSGAGKSTLAAWFQDHGFPLLCDDVCVIDLTLGGPVVWPGLPRLRLWRDALERSGRAVAGYRRSFEEEGDDWEKYDVPATTRAQSEGSVPLGGVFLLERGEQPGLEALSPREALGTLFSNIYRGEYLVGGQHETMWRACLAVAAAVPVRRWHRRWDPAAIDDDIAGLVDAIRNSAR